MDFPESWQLFIAQRECGSHKENEGLKKDDYVI